MFEMFEREIHMLVERTVKVFLAIQVLMSAMWAFGFLEFLINREPVQVGATGYDVDMVEEEANKRLKAIFLKMADSKAEVDAELEAQINRIKDLNTAIEAMKVDAPKGDDGIRRHFDQVLASFDTIRNNQASFNSRLSILQGRVFVLMGKKLNGS